MNRREWNALTFGSMAALILPKSAWAATPLLPDKPDSKINGVQIGVQSYSFRDRSLDEAIKAMSEIGLSSCELWSGHLEPKELANNEDKRKWRLTTPLSEFEKSAAKFKKAGIKLSAFSFGFRDHMTEEEMDRIFGMAKALGVDTITTSTTVSLAPKIDTLAQKHKIKVGLHNHSKKAEPNELSGADSFARALQGTSDYMRINLDIGHFVAADEDPVAFMKQHHNRIVMIHVKDRKRNQGPNVSFGEGETPIKEALTLMRQNKYPFPANIEYEYKGADSVAEVKKCFDYCRQALA